MSGRINLLAAVLALQLVLVGLLLLADVAGDGSQPSAWLGGDASSVSAVEIVDADDRSVRLQRSADGWLVSGSAGPEAASWEPLPADGAKVAEVLDKLFGQRVQWPVGTTGQTRERFEVTEASFQRRLALEDDAGAVTQVYLGTSPGYRRVHARLADADEVYSIDFANYQVPADLDEWVDKTLLAARGSISEVAREDGWMLTREGDGWLVDGRAADPQAAQDLVDRLGDLRIIGVAPADGGASEQQTGADVAVLKVTDEAGTYVLRLSGTQEDTEYRITSDRLQGRFTVAAYVAEQLLPAVEDLTAGDGEAADPANAGE